MPTKERTLNAIIRGLTRKKWKTLSTLRRKEILRRKVSAKLRQTKARILRSQTTGFRIPHEGWAATVRRQKGRVQGRVKLRKNERDHPILQRKICSQMVLAGASADIKVWQSYSQVRLRHEPPAEDVLLLLEEARQIKGTAFNVEEEAHIRDEIRHSWNCSHTEGYSLGNYISLPCAPRVQTQGQKVSTRCEMYPNCSVPEVQFHNSPCE